MKNKFPEVEEIGIEEIYGTKRPESKPQDIKSTYNLRKEQKSDIIFSENKIIVNDAISDKERTSGITEIENYIEKRNIILNLQNKNGHVKYADCVNMPLSDFVKIKSFLENSKQINYQTQIRKNTTKIQEYLRKIKDEDALDELINSFDKTFKPNEMEYELFDYDKCVKCDQKEVLFFNLKNSSVLCQYCLRNGEFSDDITFSNFIPLSEISEKLKLTDKLVLSAVYKHGDDWSAIAKELETPEEECVVRFLKINLTQKCTLDFPVFHQSKNRIMSVVSFLCTCVDQKLASEFAREIIKTYEHGHTEEELITNALMVCQARAKQILGSERKKFERAFEVIIQSQIRKLELKEATLKDLNNQFTNERTELGKFRDLYKTELDELRREKN